MLAEYAYVLAVGVSDFLLIKTVSNEFFEGHKFVGNFPNILHFMCEMNFFVASFKHLITTKVYKITLCTKQKCVESANVNSQGCIKAGGN